MTQKMDRSLNEQDRREIAKQLMTLAHIAVASLLFSQALSGHPFSLPGAILGVLIFALAYYLAIRLMKGGGIQ